MMYTDYTKFQDLNLSDDFLFSKVMGDETVLRPVVEKILGIQIREMTIVQPQKMIEIESDSKGIRLDIMADDEEGAGTVLRCRMKMNIILIKEADTITA